MGAAVYIRYICRVRVGLLGVGLGFAGSRVCSLGLEGCSLGLLFQLGRQVWGSGFLVGVAWDSDFGNMNCGAALATLP